jgi:hypothetical protein
MAFSDDPRMTSLRVKLSRITAKKVPALALVVVGLVGMVAGVLAAAITINPVAYTGETGTYHNNTGAFTVTDTGLAVVSSSASPGNATNAITIAGTGIALDNALTAGHWMDVITFLDNSPATSAGTHTATITFRDGAGPQGTIIATVTSGLWTTTSGSTGTVTVYVDLGSASLSGPVTAYINVN